MNSVIVTLYTGDHCVETASKAELRRLTARLLEAEDEAVVEKLGEQLELLREFIEASDFNELRSSDERLAGIRPGLVLVARDSGGRPFIKIISGMDRR